MSEATGILSIVSTPIGNLGDLSPRARDCLSQADFIAAEDTRVTKSIMRRLCIPFVRLISCHEHNESQRIEMILNRLRSGARVVLVSDAGTPLMNDPGYLLVSAAIDEGIDVQCVPGPNAALAALTVAGLPTNRYLVCGYLPKARGQRLAAIEELKFEQATLVLFESPIRVLDLLSDLRDSLGDRKAALANNITKEDEQIYRGSLGEIAEQLKEMNRVHGEFTLVVDQPQHKRQEASDEIIERTVARLLREDLRPRTVRDIISDVFGLRKQLAYERVLEKATPQSGIDREHDDASERQSQQAQQ